MISKLLCLLLIAVLPLSAQEKMSRLEKETYLKKARVISTREIGEGISKPLKVQLERDGVLMKAIYKNIVIVYRVCSL